MTPRHLTAFAVTTVAAGLFVYALAAPTPAQACGGFFCSQVPMDQSGENIVFGIEDGRVTAHINIQYVGEAEDFAWVVPVASNPTINVGTLELFQQLEWRTQPQWSLLWDDQSQCGGWWLFATPEAMEDDADGGTVGGVEVIQEKEVGPYNAVVLASDDASALITWLNDNGFDQPESSTALIQYYLDINHVFVAVKLQKGESSGDIVPLVLKFAEPAGPCIPLVLTQIAAQPDMPVKAYVMSDARAVPTNWFEVEVNEKRIDWMNSGQNYGELAIEAVDEAAGHGFITEFAGELDMSQSLWWEGRFDLDQLRAIESPATFVSSMLGMGFPRTATTQNLIRKYIPKPDGVEEDREFYNNLEDERWAAHLAGIDFDPIAFAADLDERIVQPAKAAQEMVDRFPYTTRMFTAVSPEDMTRDPQFQLNREAPDVSNIHQAAAEAECDDQGVMTLVTITLANGETITIEGPFDNWWSTPFEDPAADESAAGSIVLWGADGQPESVTVEAAGAVDAKLNVLSGEQVLAELEAGLLGTGGGTTVVTPPVGTGGDMNGSGPGCAASGGAGDFVLILLGLLLLLPLRRRSA